MMQNKIEIYVVTHKKYDIPKKTIYIPLQVGAYFNHKIYELTDVSFEDNIGEKNQSFCELTGLYNIWKYAHGDILGLVHYRRYFVSNIITNNISQCVLDSKKITRIMMDYDIIVPRPLKFKTTVYDKYKLYHNENDIVLCFDKLKQMYPDYSKEADEVLYGNHIYICNMFIAKNNILKSYCEWLFPLLFNVEKDIDTSSYDSYQNRVIGFLAERLFNVWLKKNIPLSAIYECDIDSCESKTPIWKQQIKHILKKPNDYK